MSTPLPWHQIDTVLLDMDGTLIDLHFDRHLWQTLVPVRYAERLGLPLAEAKAQIDTHYHAVNGTLDWYCVDYWTRTLGLDIRALKQEILEKIQWRPNVIPFLAALKAAGKQVVLFTNAHPASLSVKDARLGLAQHLDLMVSTHELGWSKESQHCWQALAERLAFDPARTLFVDDSERILAASAEFGIAHQLGIRHPDSQMPPLTFQHFPALDDYADLLPLGA
ncbi:GMP/IMP nucleotidase [Aeromonas caviae]|uniref:GMP/IMP nucleotidase n=1 Tax=Aeromonas TaxID=642 RepID=UPI001B31EAA1|nr:MULTISPECIES: GMP/IMP nucleotidase [Aeromonas]MBP4031463.1 GMP/IMP nucleotidase [Aeromonas sp. PrichA-15]MCR3892905.1 GMP/IMP nucleotidase [Aeromonas caviae]